VLGWVDERLDNDPQPSTVGLDAVVADLAVGTAVQPAVERFGMEDVLVGQWLSGRVAPAGDTADDAERTADPGVGDRRRRV
jgi:hypothetical protein